MEQFIVWSALDLKPIAQTIAESKEKAYEQYETQTMKRGEWTIHYIKNPDSKTDEIFPIVILPKTESEEMELFLRGPRGDDKLRRMILSLPLQNRFAILENGKELIERLLARFTSPGRDEIERN